MGATFAAFLSYSRGDDEYDDGAITQLAKRLERALRAFTGRSDLAVFLDREAIEWGDAWRDRIREGVNSSAALIAVVTPSYLASEECRREYEDFMNQPAANRWFLPLYYIEVDDLDARDDSVSNALRAAQYADWRTLRESDPTSATVRREIEALARRIRDLLRKSMEADDSGPGPSMVNPPQGFPCNVTSEGEGEDWLDLVIAARAALDDEEYGLARALLLGGLDSYPQPELVHELAVVDWYDGALEDAVGEFEWALANGIPRGEVIQGLGQVRVELGDFERGIDELSRLSMPQAIPSLAPTPGVLVPSV